MTATTQPDLRQQLQETVILLIRSSDAPDRVKAALEAARLQIMATGEIIATGEAVIAGQVLGEGGATRPATEEELAGEFDGPAFVDEPVHIPGGYLLMIDFKCTPPELCQEVPGILVRHLEEAEVRDAEICLAPALSNSRFTWLDSLAPIAQAWLYSPYPPVGVFEVQAAPWLLDVATEWLRKQHQPEMELLALVISTEVPLTWETLRSVMDDVLASETRLSVISSDFQTSAMTVFAGDPGSTGVTLGAAGDGWTVEQVAAQMRGQRDAIRSVASELSWAGVSAHRPTYSLDLLSPNETLRSMADGARPSAREAQGLFQRLMRRRSSVPPGSVERIIGEPEQWMPGLRDRPEFAHDSEERVKAVRAVPPPMWYQVFSQELVQQFGGAPPGSIDLGNGSLELTIGEPEQWVPGHPDYEVIRARGRALFLGMSSSS